MSRYIKNKTEVFSILSYGLILNRFGSQSNKKTYRVLVNFDTYIYSMVLIIISTDTHRVYLLSTLTLVVSVLTIFTSLPYIVSTVPIRVLVPIFFMQYVITSRKEKREY